MDGRAKADIVFVGNDTNAALWLHCASPAIVHHDHLEIRKRLTVKRSEAFRQCLISRERRYNDRHGWRNFAGERWVHFRFWAPAHTCVRIVVCIGTYYTF